MPLLSDFCELWESPALVARAYLPAAVPWAAPPELAGL